MRRITLRLVLSNLSHADSANRLEAVEQLQKLLIETSAAPLPPALAMLVLWHLDDAYQQYAGESPSINDTTTKNIAVSLIKYILRKWRLQDVLARNTPIEEIMALTQGVRK